MRVLEVLVLRERDGGSWVVMLVGDEDRRSVLVFGRRGS